MTEASYRAWAYECSRLIVQKLISQLSVREIEVLKLIAEGKPNKLVADALAISPKTVEKHRGKLQEKLHVHSVAELTKIAVAAKLTPLLYDI